MTRKLNLALALALSVIGVSAQAAEQYFMRMPAPAKCAGTSCVMRARAADAPTTAPEEKPGTPRGSITSSAGSNFGLVAVGMSGAIQLTITNTGTVPIVDASVESNAAGLNVRFGPGQTTCGTVSRKLALAPGATCKATVGFLPTEQRDYAGTIYLRSATTSDPLATYGVSGKGGIASPVLDVTALNFGAVAVGASVVRSVTVTNTGDAPHYIGFGQEADSAGNRVVFSVASSCPEAGNYQLPGGRSCTYTVTATPTVVGPVNYNLYLNFGSVHPGYTVPMTVTGQ